MMDPEYKEALKAGQKEYKACISRGESPYLPVLDDILPECAVSGEQDLGIVQIPMSLIVGTKTAGRSNAFAKNFMPIANEMSEFAVKWERLCQSHLEEGIREPVKAYEYMNRFYVEEGNKRVSVLRYFDAVSVTAHVIRILPEKNGSKESLLYYEFVDFYKISKINYLEFSKPGGYARLQAYLGKAPEELWTQEEQRLFASTYYAFRNAYYSAGGKQLSSTVGDAMLAYLEVYDYQSIREKSPQTLKKELGKIWEEVTLQQEEAPIDVKLDPPEKKQGLISKVLSGDDGKVIRAAFVHDSSPESSGWTEGHERGREYIQRIMDGQVETAPYYHALDRDPQSVIEEAISDGNNVIFTTSPRLLPASLKAAVDHPEVTIFNCSLNQPHRYIRTYYPRMYEIKFIIGAIAGSLAGNDPVGYLCDYPIFGQIAGINAFALGVQMTNPRAKVYLEWSSVGGIDSALKRLTDQGIRLISSQDMFRRGDKWHTPGLSLITDENQVNLATPLWQWGTYYEEILKRIKNRAVRSEYTETNKAMNYYWGISAGVVDLRCSDKIHPAAVKMAGLLKDSIRAGLCNPFKGPLYTQNGRVLENDQLLTPAQIISMDYLMDNIKGEIPQYNALSDVAKATVDMVGVGSATKEKRN